MAYIVEQDSKILRDRLGNMAEVGAFGELKVANTSTEVAITFGYPLDTIHSVNISNTGTCTSTAQYNGSLLKVQTNGTGTAAIESKKALRYSAGSTGGAYLTAPN